MSLITYNPNASVSAALSSTKLDDVIKPMCLSKAEAKVQARVQAKEAKVQARELAKQEKLQARELAKQSKLQERELAKQEKKLEKLQERELAKQVNVQARELAKQEKKLEKTQERETLKKRKERVKEIKKQHQKQVKKTTALFRMNRLREREIARARRAAAQRERENDVRRAREAAAALVARENTNRARIQREERHMRRLIGMVDADLTEVVLGERLGRGLPIQERLEGRNRDRRRHAEREMTAVNPMQELINQDQIDCNKTREELILVENAYEVTDCPICFDELGNTNQMILRCGHKVCGDCIMEHMPRVGGLKCPICREQYGVRINGWAPPLPRR